MISPDSLARDLLRNTSRKIRMALRQETETHNTIEQASILYSCWNPKVLKLNAHLMESPFEQLCIHNVERASRLYTQVLKVGMYAQTGPVWSVICKIRDFRAV